MKQVHMKQKLIATAVAGALMIPGSAMTVHAADNETRVNAASKIVGIESILKEYDQSSVKNGFNLYSVFTSIGDYLKAIPSEEGKTSSEDIKKEETKANSKLAENERDKNSNTTENTNEAIEKSDEDISENDKITVATVTADVLNVRAGQGTDYQILLQILEQERYEVTGDSVNGWYPITVGQIDGWVSGEWITVDKVDKAEFITAEQIPQGNVDAGAQESENMTLPDEAVSQNADAVAQEAVALTSTSYTTGQQVIDFACQFIGNPYVWGGTSLTNGVDCSGFVQSVYANFGINLPRTTWDMENVGYEVPYDQAQPGDLVLYDGHVGLYMGDGNIVNAMNEVDGIGICTATYAPIVTVRRVL